MDEARILIADDSKMNQQLLSEILGTRYDYLYADDGVQALDLLHEHFDIDLLLLDINMPHLDGFGVLEVMRQRNWTQEIPVIIISSEDDADLIQKAYDLGVTDYIGRPFNLAVVRRRVNNALTLYARQKDLVHLAEEQVYEREKTNTTMINILGHVVESKNFESGTHILHVRTITDLLLHQLVKMTDRYPLSQADIFLLVGLPVFSAALYPVLLALFGRRTIVPLTAPVAGFVVFFLYKALSFSSVLHTVLCSILYLAVLVFFLLTALGVLRTRIFLLLLAGLPLLVHIIMDLSDYESFFLFLPELSVLLLMASLLCLALRLRPAGRREKT